MATHVSMGAIFAARKLFVNAIHIKTPVRIYYFGVIAVRSLPPIRVPSFSDDICRVFVVSSPMPDDPGSNGPVVQVGSQKSGSIIRC